MRWSGAEFRRCTSMAGMAMLGACGGAQTPTTGSQTAPVHSAITLAVHATPDSAVKLARFALGSIDGTIQIPQVRPTFTRVSTHYTRNRHGGGTRQVAIILAVDRKMSDSVNVVTLVELSGWALDLAQQQSASARRAGVPATPLSTNAPALRQPRLLTQRDTSDYGAVVAIAEMLERHGARRLP